MAAGTWQLQSCTNDAKYLCLEIFTAKPNGKRYLAALSGCNPLKNILRGGGGYPPFNQCRCTSNPKRNYTADILELKTGRTSYVPKSSI
jgi:hypothetical protein